MPQLKDVKYRYIDTEEVIKASKWAYDFLMLSYKTSEKGNRTTHPRELTKDQLIEYGMSLLDEDEDYERV